MEGTHTVLQLHRPIMELCYVSFCLPKGKIRGFTYKGCVTLDRSNKRFHNCYQVREGSQAAGSSGQSCENIEDIFFKQTPTKDILAELYKLNAEKEKLLATLLSSSHILGVKMGNQDGKLEGEPQSLAYKNEDNLDFRNQQETLLGSVEIKPTLKNKKTRKFSKRRESIEDFINKKIKRKVPRVLDTLALESKDILLGCDKLSSARHPGDISSSPYQAKTEGKDDISSEKNKPPERSRRDWHLLEDSRALGSDTDSSVSFSEYDNNVLGHCFAHSSHSLLDDVEDTLKVMQEHPSNLVMHTFQEIAPSKSESFDIAASTERLHSKNCIAETGNIRLDAVRDLPKVQDSEHLQRALKTEECGQRVYSSNKCINSVFATEIQEKEREGFVQQYKREQEHVIDESCKLAGAVNKTLLKVIQNDRVDETAEWKRLQHITRADRSPPGLGYGKKTADPQESSKHLSLSLPIGLYPDIYQARTDVKPEDKRQPSPPLAAVSNVFNNSYPASNTHKQMSPPLSSRLPSPQLHHRILPLPTPDTVEEAGLSGPQSTKYYSTNLPLDRVLEAQPPKCFESEHSGLFMRQPSLHQGAPEDLFGESTPTEKTSIQLHSG